MEFTEEDLIKFISLYEEAYGEKFTREFAERELSKLLQLYKLVYLTPLPTLGKKGLTPAPKLSYAILLKLPIRLIVNRA